MTLFILLLSYVFYTIKMYIIYRIYLERGLYLENTPLSLYLCQITSVSLNVKILLIAVSIFIVL